MSHIKTHCLVVTLVILISLLSGYYSFFISPPKILITNDGVTEWEERIEPVKKRLPPDVQEVGYISDNENTAIIQEYSLTRYAMAPIVVRQGGHYKWIIGNFTQPGFENIIAVNVKGDFEMEKFGAGIYLIHRTNP